MTIKQYFSIEDFNERPINQLNGLKPKSAHTHKHPIKHYFSPFMIHKIKIKKIKDK